MLEAKARLSKGADEQQPFDHLHGQTLQDQIDTEQAKAGLWGGVVVRDDGRLSTAVFIRRRVPSESAPRGETRRRAASGQEA